MGGHLHEALRHGDSAGAAAANNGRMNEHHDPREPQPWHEADEKPAKPKKGHAPVGTHSLTGGGASVGMPPRAEDAERSVPDPVDSGLDALAEPRAGSAGKGPLGPPR